MDAPAIVATDAPVLVCRNVSRTFWRRQGLFGVPHPLHAVHQVDLHLGAGETLGLVGESGCGKSTLARLIVGLQDADSGEIHIGGDSLFACQIRQGNRESCSLVQMVFQDPYSSLNPRMRVLESVCEPLLCVLGLTGEKCREAGLEILERVGISTAQAQRYPHEFSGGQRQRIAIARALALHPQVVVCDEPTSSLDASVQAQVLNLLCDLQEELGLAYLFISHDLSVVAHMSDRVAVMYSGRIVEEGNADTVFSFPAHPYTEALLAAVPGPEHKGTALPDQDMHTAVQMHPGCSFSGRCPYRQDICDEKEPELLPLSASGQLVRCYFPRPGIHGGSL